MTIECVSFEAQTGIIASKPSEISNFYQYAIPKDKLAKLKAVAAKVPNLTREDLEWLANNDVSPNRASFSIFPRKTMVVY